MATVNYLMITLTVSIPLGLMFASMYGALVRAGHSASFILGVFQ